MLTTFHQANFGYGINMASTAAVNSRNSSVSSPKPANRNNAPAFSGGSQWLKLLKDFATGLVMRYNGPSSAAIDGWEVARVQKLFPDIKSGSSEGLALRFYAGEDGNNYLGYISPKQMSSSDESGIGSGTFVDGDNRTIFYRMSNEMHL